MPCMAYLMLRMRGSTDCSGLIKCNKDIFEYYSDWDTVFRWSLRLQLKTLLPGNILVLHQNRAKRGPTNYIHESFLPDFFHLIIWGHENDCRIIPEASDRDFFICQPGSPTATSMC